MAILLLLVLTGFFLFAPAEADRRFNAIEKHAAGNVSQHAKELHQTLQIVDLHADSLLWNRNLLQKNDRGHVDIPRMIEGNIALQAFTIVTKVPGDLKLERNKPDTDDITLLALAQLWPPATWSSLSQRTLYQCTKLNNFAENSAGKFSVIKTADELRAYLRKRKTDLGCTAGIIGIEGAHALDGELKNIDVFFDNGVRMMAPTHFFDNDIGASAHGLRDYGLTEKGKEMVRHMQEKGMLVDVAHASPRVISDVLEISKKPIVVSHTGVKGVCDNARNLTDSQLKGIAKTGGVIGIGFWPTAVCGSDANAIARSIKYTADLVGVDHVALGSDFDGTVTAPFDCSELILLTQALIDVGFSDTEIRKIMGENTIRVMCADLP